MNTQHDISSLEALLDRLQETPNGSSRITVGMVMRTVGRRSFGPMLLIPGLIALSPLSGLPGAPTMVGIMVLAITGQYLLGRSEFWLPACVLRRSISKDRFEKAIRVLRPVGRFTDRLFRPRLTALTKGMATYGIAGVCLILAGAAPLLEVVPFAITGVGATVTAFGLALTVEDGVLALVALASSAITIGLVAYAWL